MDLKMGVVMKSNKGRDWLKEAIKVNVDLNGMSFLCLLVDHLDQEKANKLVRLQYWDGKPFEILDVNLLVGNVIWQVSAYFQLSVSR